MQVCMHACMYACMFAFLCACMYAAQVSSFASAVSGSLPPTGASSSGPSTNVPLTRAAVTSVVVGAIRDAERRKKNIIITGIPECSDVSDAGRVSQLLSNNFHELPTVSILSTLRLGKADGGSKHRRLLVRLGSEQEALTLLRSAKSLRSAADPVVASSVFINPDLSREESKQAFERRARRRAGPEASAPSRDMGTDGGGRDGGNGWGAGRGGRDGGRGRGGRDGRRGWWAGMGGNDGGPGWGTWMGGRYGGQGMGATMGCRNKG